MQIKASYECPKCELPIHQPTQPLHYSLENHVCSCHIHDVLEHLRVNFPVSLKPYLSTHFSHIGV